MDREEKVITDRAALRMVRKIFAGLALLFVALYATAWLRSLRPEWLLSMYSHHLWSYYIMSWHSVHSNGVS